MNNDLLIGIFASTGFWAFLTVVFTSYREKHKKEDDNSKVIKAALLALLHDALYEKMTAVIAVGAVSPDDYENINQMMKPYDALGGNGTIHKLWGEIEKLPTYKEDGKNE